MNETQKKYVRFLVRLALDSRPVISGSPGHDGFIKGMKTGMLIVAKDFAARAKHGAI